MLSGAKVIIILLNVQCFQLKFSKLKKKTGEQGQETRERVKGEGRQGNRWTSEDVVTCYSVCWERGRQENVGQGERVKGEGRQGEGRQGNRWTGEAGSNTLFIQKTGYIMSW